jgi:hypothetical protein
MNSMLYELAITRNFLSGFLFLTCCMYMQIASLALQNQTLVMKLQQTSKDAVDTKYHNKGSGEKFLFTEHDVSKFSATISEVGIICYILNKLAFTLIIGSGETLICLHLNLNYPVCFKSLKY